MSYEISAQGWTATTMGATGATTLVSAPAAGSSTRILQIQVINQTTTTGFVELGFRDSDGTAYVRHVSNSLAASQVFEFGDKPWLLSTAGGLQAVLSVTAASTPSVRIAVQYETVSRVR